MTIDTLIMLAGAFVAALPFLGFPQNWQSALLFVAGVAVIALGIVVRRRTGRMSDHRHADFEVRDPHHASDSYHANSR